MATYVITGVSKGLGFEFLRQISNDPMNTVIGIVRDKPTTNKRVTEELEGRPNIHILQANVTNYDSLKKAAVDTAAITSGGLDYLIANAGYVSSYDAYDPIGVLANDPQALSNDLLKLVNTNITGNIYLFNLFLPLILKGREKKVVVLTTGHTDIDLINKYDITSGSLYTISKAGMNAATAKFSAQYKEHGVLFLSICPGAVEVGHARDANPEQIQSLMRLAAKFQQYAPHFTGPVTPEAAVRDVINVWGKCSIENGDGGTVLSHYGNKQWL